MKVFIANTIGFCDGIKRAVRMVNELLSSTNATVYASGELTHNINVMNSLFSAGLKNLSDSFEKINTNDVILIRAHGVSPNERKTISSVGCHLTDATCPHVIAMAKILQKFTNDGYEIVIVGDKSHAEIVGLIGYCDKYSVILNQSDAERFMSNSDKILVLSQSTLDQVIFDEVCEILEKKYPKIVIKNTICASTRNRQKEIFNLKMCGIQAIVIVGGKHSANTNTLVNVSKNIGLQAFHVENVNELKACDLSKIDAVGVASGASTDMTDIDDVVRYLQSL